jgi:hypothetical protein
MDTVNTLVVATHRAWVADEFAPACERADVTLVRSLGFDVPDLTGAGAVAWWTPTEHAARLLASGVPFPMQAPGPGWLDTVPAEMARRSVWTGPVERLVDVPWRSGWCKPAEFKHPDLPAAWFDDVTDFADACALLDLPADAVVQVADTRLDLAWEHRFVVAHGAVLGGSPYLAPDGSLWEDGMTSPPAVHASAAAFAADVAASVPGPPGYVLDVATTHDGAPLVLEANPAFSSALYGTDPDAALTALTASATGGAWQWVPDPFLRARASRQRPLPRR